MGHTPTITKYFSWNIYLEALKWPTVISGKQQLEILQSKKWLNDICLSTGSDVFSITAGGDIKPRCAPSTTSCPWWLIGLMLHEGDVKEIRIDHRFTATCPQALRSQSHCVTPSVTPPSEHTFVPQFFFETEPQNLHQTSVFFQKQKSTV